MSQPKFDKKKFLEFQYFDNVFPCFKQFPATFTSNIFHQNASQALKIAVEDRRFVMILSLLQKMMKFRPLFQLQTRFTPSSGDFRKF